METAVEIHKVGILEILLLEITADALTSRAHTVPQVSHQLGQHLDQRRGSL
jgi:hypothetical protein